MLVKWVCVAEEQACFWFSQVGSSSLHQNHMTMSLFNKPDAELGGKVSNNRFSDRPFQKKKKKKVQCSDSRWRSGCYIMRKSCTGKCETSLVQHVQGHA